MANNSKIRIIDASVVVKWFNKEIYTENALDLRDRFIKREFNFYVPSLLFYEVANALRYNPELGENDVNSAIQNLMDLQLKIADINIWFLKSISLAYKFGITIYDSAYIALGFYLGSPIITADEKLIEKIQLPQLIHIKDL
ncbi:MAG: type II toxin-antitoxin system VapC family toxin [Candidatus Helarchaeota archaeon]